MWRTDIMCGIHAMPTRVQPRKRFAIYLVTSYGLMSGLIVCYMLFRYHRRSQASMKCTVSFCDIPNTSVPATKTRGSEMDVLIKTTNGLLRLNEGNCWVCLFTEAPVYNHVYIYRERTDEHSGVSVIFEHPQIIDQLMENGFPMQIRRYPTEWDEEAFSEYLTQQCDDIDSFRIT